MIKQLYKEQDLPYGDLQKIGLAENGALKLNDDDRRALLSGRRTAMLRLENLSSDGLHIPQLDAKLSLKPDPLGDLGLLVHPIYRQAQQLPFLTGTETEQLEKGEVPNIEKMIFDDEHNAREVLVEFDRETGEFVVTDQARILAPDQVNGQRLSLEQKERYRKGKEVELADGTVLQYSATEKKGMRSNKLALIASVLVDGGLSFALYHGLNHLFGEKKHRQDAGVFSKGYHTDLAAAREQPPGQSNLNGKPDKRDIKSLPRTATR